MSFGLADRAARGEFDRRVVDIDRAQRPAHAADVGARRLALFLVAARLVRVHRHRVHAFPVERLAIARHLVVPDFRRAHALDQVARVRGDSGRDHALAHVVDIGQPQMLGRSDVAQKIGAGGRGDRAADRAGDVVVAGGDVAGQRPEHVERRAAADCAFRASRWPRSDRAAHGPDLRSSPARPALRARSVSSPITSSSAIWPRSVASPVAPGRSPSPSEIVTSCSRRIAQTSSKCS